MSNDGHLVRIMSCSLLRVALVSGLFDCIKKNGTITMVTERGVNKVLNWNLHGLIMNDHWTGVNKNTSLEICKGE